ncbi:MAG: hypothetical protein NVSMB14_03100 [Isosphaeraceae bacterium]
MSLVVQDPRLAREIRAKRESLESGHRDEVWEGVYIVMPDPDIVHQELVTQLAAILVFMIAFPKLGRVHGGGNISNRDKDWIGNYRIPDVSVFLNDTSAIDRDSYWLGGPDFAIEVVSPDDLAREKLPFYANVGTREVLIIDREPWALELYRLRDGELRLVGVSKPKCASRLASEVIPMSFRLIEGSPRPSIEIKADGTDQTCTI